MSEYFLFFRCWPGFSGPFPFEQFNALPDDELPQALDGFVGEQLQIPGVCKQIKEVGRGRRRRFVNALNDKWKRQSPGSKPVTRWMGHAFRQECWRQVRGAEREDPLVCRLGSYLGWWSDRKVNGRAVGFPMVWFCLSPSLALAEHLVEELNRQRCLDYDKHDIEYHANPRYSFVSAEGLSLGKRSSILRCINVIREGREPDVQDAKLALLIGQRSLRVALDVAEAWPIDEDKGLLAALPPPAAVVEYQPETAADEARLPSPPSSVAELSQWIGETRELLRGHEAESIGESQIGRTVREHFLRAMERVWPDWPEPYHEFQPGKFQTIRELVVMMASVEKSFQASQARAEAQAKAEEEEKGPLGYRPPPPPPEWRFVCKKGEVYEITGRIDGSEEKANLKWMIGLEYIGKLLRSAGKPIPYAELVADAPADRPTEAAEKTAEENLTSGQWSDQPAMDKDTLRECHERVKEIDTELEDARQCNDSGRQERLEKERAEILAEVRAATGLGNRPRNINTDADNLRLRIHAALKRVYRKLEKQAPKLANHFRESISPGDGAYKYAPKLQNPPWSFDPE